MMQTIKVTSTAGEPAHEYVIDRSGVTTVKNPAFRKRTPGATQLKPVRALKHLCGFNTIRMSNAVSYAMAVHGWSWTRKPRANDIDQYANLVGTLPRQVIETAIAWMTREPSKQVFAARFNKATNRVESTRVR